MLVTILLAFCFNSCQGKIFEYPKLLTPLGTIVGKTDHLFGQPVRTFQGIPYAKPPVGENRFKKPIPFGPWEGTLLAHRFASACVQHSGNPFPWLDDMPGQSLDCLYLNLWVPYDAGHFRPKAILFWIHGGGFRIGSSRSPYYDGTALAALGDVIVVTFNYRLGVEGFLYTESTEAPGNMGLYDILESLKWVHSNIHYFGGDRNRITVFGQSAGAIAAGMFMVSPLANRLFKRAILQSGSPANLDAEDNERDSRLSEGIAKAVECMTDDMSLKNDSKAIVTCLRDRDPLELANTVGKVSDNPQRGLYPRFGDEILPVNVREAFVKGHFRNMDVMIGNVHDEGAIMITKANKDVFGFFGDKECKVNKTFGEEIIRRNFKSFPNSSAIVEHYLGKVQEKDEEKVLYQVQTASGDVSRVCPSVYIAERISDKGNQVYYYYFTHRSSNTPWAPWMDVPHFEETPYVFGYPLKYPQNYTLQEQGLSYDMVIVWSTFAKYGEQAIPQWPLYSRGSHLFYTLNTGVSVVGVGPHLKNCEFFKPYFGF